MLAEVEHGAAAGDDGAEFEAQTPGVGVVDNRSPFIEEGTGPFDHITVGDGEVASSALKICAEVLQEVCDLQGCADGVAARNCFCGGFSAVVIET